MQIKKPSLVLNVIHFIFCICFFLTLMAPNLSFAETKKREKQKLPPLNFQNYPNAELDQPKIEKALARLAQTPNFAEKYIFVSWSCGASCALTAIIDVENGQVHNVPFSTTNWHKAGSQQPFEFQANSNLLIVYGSLNEEGKPKKHYYLWESQKLKVRSTKTSLKNSQKKATTLSEKEIFQFLLSHPDETIKNPDCSASSPTAFGKTVGEVIAYLLSYDVKKGINPSAHCDFIVDKNFNLCRVQFNIDNNLEDDEFSLVLSFELLREKMKIQNVKCLFIG